MSQANAHLLNMSKAQFLIQHSGGIQAEITIDLSREIGSVDEYYRLSQITKPLDQSQIKALLHRLTQATQLRIDHHVLQWEVVDITMPANPRDDFYSGLAWPMAHIFLQTQLPIKGAELGKLSARFSGDFKFEEPIAITFIQLDSGRKMSRWLVPNQQSPAFFLSSQQATKSHDVESTHALRWQVWFDYLYMGIKHIVPKGLDHVLFVLGLFLGMRSLRQLLWLISGFTLAHSLTLALSSYGAVVLAPSIVEPLIAFSIMWVAFENILFKKANRWRIFMVFVFGLLHGLGFAQALRELGLPQDNFVEALISFNLGIELAQIAVVLSALIVVGRLRKTANWRKWVVLPGSSMISLVALYWAISRLVYW